MCTGISIRSLEDNYYWARTQEFSVDLHYYGVITPRNYNITKTLSSFTTKYAVVSIGAEELPELIIDGVNEKGLAGGSFYFAKYNRYIDEEEIRKAGKLPLSGAEFVTYALTNYSSVEELKERANKDTAIANTDSDSNFPQHYVFQDSTGASVVVEPSLDGEYEIYDNPVGVFTNSPKFDWHLVNLENYLGLTSRASGPIKMGNLSITPSGNGSGVRGIPGDFTPASRFVRAAYLKHLANDVHDENGIKLIFHILNSFDIPKGVVEVANAEVAHHTQYTSAYDITNKTMYVHTYDNKMIQKVTMKEEDYEAKDIKKYPLVEEEQYLDLRK